MITTPGHRFLRELESVFERAFAIASKHTLTTLVLIFSVGFLITITPISYLASEIQLENSLKTARLYAQAITDFRSVYTAEVVAKMRANGIEVTHDYHQNNRSIPLPATLSMVLGKKIGEHGIGGESKLYSPFPFPWREKTGGLRDSFARNAWKEISANPNQPYYEIQRKGGKKMLRYARADLLRAACVNCHNTHPQTPKTGWKEGDVRGVLEVSVNVDKSITLGSGLGEALLYPGIMIVLILSFLGFVIRKLTSSIQLVKASSDAKEKTSREVLNLIQEERKVFAAELHDNVGQIISSARLNALQLHKKEKPKDERDALVRNLNTLLSQAYDSVRDLSYSITPEKMLASGLKHGLTELTSGLQLITESKLFLYMQFEETQVSKELAVGIYSFTREVVNNAIKYAKAENINIQLIYHEEGTLTLQIEDDGIGFDLKEKMGKGMGINNMHARSQWLNAELEINSSAGNGTIVTLVFQLS